MEALDSKGILNPLRKAITSAMECADLAAFIFATLTNKIALTFAGSDGH